VQVFLVIIFISDSQELTWRGKGTQVLLSDPSKEGYSETIVLPDLGPNTEVWEPLRVIHDSLAVMSHKLSADFSEACHCYSSFL